MAEYVRALVALALLPFLAGCMGPSVEYGAPSAASGPTPAEDASNWTLHRHAMGAPASITQWANGSFALQESCNAGGCLTGSYQKTVPLGDVVPDQVPTRIRAELNHPDGNTLSSQPLTLELALGDATVYNQAFSNPKRGQIIGEWTLLKGSEPIFLWISYYFPVANGPSLDYSLRIDVSADPESTPRGVPVELALEPSRELVLEAPTSDAPSSFALYDLGGQLRLGHVATQNQSHFQVPPDLPAGHYVIVFTEGPGNVRLQSNGTAGGLHALGLRYVLGQPRPAAVPGLIEWDFQVDATPLVAGIYLKPSAVLWGQIQGALGEVRSPEGVVLQGRLGCGGVYLTGDTASVFFGSSTAAPRLVPGTYHARWDSTDSGSVGYDVGDYVVYFER